MENFKVSVIVAAYNIEKYILKCLDSITNQTLKEIEIVIVNDGSTDNTLDIIRKKALKDNRIKIVDKKNQGLIEARKSGLEIATGEYILFVDGDDWLELNTLEILYNNAVCNNSDIVIYNAYLSYNDKKIKLENFKNSTSKNYIKDLFLINIYPNIWSKFIKLDYIKLNNIEFPSKISYAEDLATVASLFMYNPNISYVNDYLYNYYQNENSITKSINTKILEINDALKFIKKILQDKNIYDIYMKEYEYMVYKHIFIYSFINKYSKVGYLGKELYNQYKSYNIKVYKNEYIYNDILTYDILRKMKIQIYLKNYNLGRVLEKLLNTIRKG